jgi:hypothetical protein
MPAKQDPIEEATASTAKNETDQVAAGLQQLASTAMADSWIERVSARRAERTVSANEITSLTALIAYVASATKINEFRIEREMADRFNVANVTCLPASRFDDAIRYLVDRVPV